MEICHQMAFGFQTVGVAGSRSSTGGMFGPPREFNRSTDRELNDRRRKKNPYRTPWNLRWEILRPPEYGDKNVAKKKTCLPGESRNLLKRENKANFLEVKLGNLFAS